MALTKKQREEAPASDFAVPGKKKLWMPDIKHTKLAWDMVTRTGDLTAEERAEARKRILARAKQFKLDTSKWNVPSTEDLQIDGLAAVADTDVLRVSVEEIDLDDIDEAHVGWDVDDDEFDDVEDEDSDTDEMEIVNIFPIHELSMEIDGDELEDSHAELDDGCDDLSDALIDVAGLEAIADAIETITYESFMSPQAALYANAAAQIHLKRLGFNIQVFPSLEAFQEKRSAMTATHLSLESLQETLNKVWEALKEFIRRVIEAVKRFVRMLFENLPRLRSMVKSLQRELGERTGTPSSKTIHLGYASSTFEIDGRVAGIPHVLSDIRTLMESVVEEWAKRQAAAINHLAQAINAAIKERSSSESSQTILNAFRQLTSPVPSVLKHEVFSGNLHIKRSDPLPGNYVLEAVYPQVLRKEDPSSTEMANAYLGVSIRMVQSDKGASQEDVEINTPSLTECKRILEDVDDLVVKVDRYRQKEHEFESATGTNAFLRGSLYYQKSTAPDSKTRDLMTLFHFFMKSTSLYTQAPAAIVKYVVSTSHHALHVVKQSLQLHERRAA